MHSAEKTAENLVGPKADWTGRRTAGRMVVYSAVHWAWSSADHSVVSWAALKVECWVLPKVVLSVASMAARKGLHWAVSKAEWRAAPRAIRWVDHSAAERAVPMAVRLVGSTAAH